jgi:hypothetical protein
MRIPLLVTVGISLFLSSASGLLAAPGTNGNGNGIHRWPPDPAAYAKPGTPVAAGLAVGNVLDQTNADRARGMLPPEILAHYKNGGYRNPIVSWPPGIINYEEAFETATRENVGKYSLDPDTGTIIDMATGAPPEYIYGIPFPRIADDDPDAGAKALWNQFYLYWNQGSVHLETLIVWTSPDRVDRISLQDIYYQYYENQAPRYRRPNPEGYTWQFVSFTRSPVDLEGTVAMSYRYRDPKKRDSVWTYVPALRRVRPVSPANRSDGFLGSDQSQDDGPFFDGKIEDFNWKIVGHREQLRLVDPDSIAGKCERRPLPGGGWRTISINNDRAVGYMVDGWDGIAWASPAGALAKRRFWVVEGVPKDRYYLYGKIQLWIDDQTWQGAWNRKFSWRGELLNVYQVMGFATADFNDQERFWGSTMGYQLSENIKLGRATVSGMNGRGADPANDRRIPLDPEFFQYQTLSRFGK